MQFMLKLNGKSLPNGFTKTILLLYHSLLSARICPLSYFWLVKSMQDIKGNVNFTLFQSSSDNSSVQSSAGARNPVHVQSRAGRRGTFVPDISSERVRQVINCFGRVLCFNLSSCTKSV